MKLRDYIEKTYTMTCSAGFGCEEDNTGRFPNNQMSVIASSIVDAERQFKEAGWREIVTDDAMGIACPSCVEVWKEKTL